MTAPTITERAEAFLAANEKYPSRRESCKIIKGLMAELAEAWSECRDNEALIKQLGAQLDDTARNANRYLHLRNSAHFGGNDQYNLKWYLPRSGKGTLQEQFDDAVDAALKTAKGTT